MLKGGAVFLENVLMEINNSIFSHNNATFGGAIYITSSLLNFFFFTLSIIIRQHPSIYAIFNICE